METKVRILHLEDEASDAKLIKAKLFQSGLSCRITRAQTRGEFETALLNGGTDIILADYQLPDYNGMSALRLTTELRPDIPFIFVTGAMGEEAAIEALTQGATDYVLKHNLSRLAPAVQRALQEAWNRHERKRAEQQVALMGFALNGIHEAALMIDMKAEFQYVNEEACRLLEYTRDELLAMTLFDINPGFPKEHWPGHWYDLMQQGAVTFEEKLKTKTGRIFPVEINANYFEYEGRRFGIGLVRDITERKQAERVRLANLKFFESMDRINRAIQGAWDIDTMMSEALDAVLSIFDCDRAYLLHPCDPEANGWTVPMERCKPEYPGVLTSEQLIPMTAAVAGTFDLLLNTDGPVKFGPGADQPLSETISERFGFKRLMAMALYPKAGKPWQFGIHQCSHERTWTPEEEKLFREIGRRLADGLTSWLTFQDLEKSRKDLHRLNKELESRVMERTRELEVSHAELEKAYQDLKTAHTRMLQQEKMASIGQLAAGVAHEINNPLAFVISNLGTLGRYVREIGAFVRTLEKEILGGAAASSDTGAALPARVKQLRKTADIDFILEDIEAIVAESLDGGDRMKQIVQNLKSFARLDEGTYKMADLNQGLESTLKIVWNEVKYKAVVTKSYGDLPETLCNPDQLNQVFMNLLINAAHAIEHQGQIDIRTRMEADLIFIEIADTGCGIPEDKVNRIFEPFFTTKAVGKGTGLGLSIVYDIVEKHGGEIDVQSEPGRGTRFTLSLPVRAETEKVQ